MKNLILILFAFLSVEYAYAQKVVIKNKASVVLPKNSTKITESSAGVRSLKKQSLTFSYILKGNSDVYEIDGFPIALNPENGKVPDNHLEKRKIAMDYDSKRDIEKRNSEIKRYDGFKALIVYIEWKSKPHGEISITCVDSTKTKLLGAYMEYPKDSRAKAEKTLDNLLRTWKFY